MEEAGGGRWRVSELRGAMAGSGSGGGLPGGGLSLRGQKPASKYGSHAIYC